MTKQNAHRVACIAAALALSAGAPAPASDTVVGLAVDGRAERIIENANAALGLQDSSVFRLSHMPAAGEPILAVIAAGAELIVVELRPHSVRGAHYELLVQGEDGVVAPATPSPVNTFRGEAISHPGSTVAASVLEDGLHLRLHMDDGSDLWIEPLAGRVEGAGENDYILYDGAHVMDLGGTCGSDASYAVDLVAPGAIPAEGGGIAGAGFCADLAADTDYEFFQARGSVASVEGWINATVNAVNVQYERDVDITHSLSAIVVRATSNDPYNNTKNASSLLNQVRSEWENNQGAITRDLAQLFTGRQLAGSTIGIAWVGSVCTSYQYSLVETLFNGNDPSPDACATDLSAHELGHNWGAGHCSCTSYTMNSYITCANVFHPTATIPSIIAHRNSRTCLNDCGGGTPTGACCVGSTCSIQTAAGCAGGIYQGDGTTCSPDPCGGSEPTGACCTDSTCSIQTEAACSGTYQGDGTTCSPDPCSGTGGNAIVDCITYTTRGGPQQNKHLDVTVTVVDGSNTPIGGATVSMTLTRSGGGSWNFGGSTDGSGHVRFTLGNAANGCYTSDVTAISGAGLTFDGTEPANGFQKGSDSIPDTDCRSGSDGCGSG